jgi:oligopeptide/dipeptide ABC transporter ATP-binding protein
MRQRAAIAQALATNPSVIVLDEPVSALDVSIRAQILNLLKDVQSRYGLSYILIAHDLATVRYLSHNVAAMYLGSIMEQAPAEAFFTRASHPYTIALLSAAMPKMAERTRHSIVLSGDLPSPANPPPGCSFHTRCWLRKSLDSPAICAKEKPSSRTIGRGHNVACDFIDETQETWGRRQILSQILPSGQNRSRGENVDPGRS